MKKIILQEERNLDDVLKSAIRTFPNGCNFRLTKEANDKYYLEYGCYGVLVNLLTGDERLLYKWFISNNKEQIRKCLSDVVSYETILFLLKKETCSVCGGIRFFKKN